MPQPSSGSSPGPAPFAPEDGAPSPASARSLLRSAAEARQAGRHDEAIALLERAITCDPADLRLRLGLADLLRGQGRLDAADTAYQAVLAQAPENVQALFCLGLMARRRRRIAAALDWFLKAAAAERDQSNIHPRLQCAEALRELGRPEEAEAAYRAVLERAPTQFSALLGLGFIARRRADYAGALAWFERAAAANPDPTNFAARLQAGEMLRELGRFDAAENRYRAVLEQSREQPEALLGLGLLARRRLDFTGALAWFTQAVATGAGPAVLPVRLHQAEMLRELGRTEEAEATYEAVLAHAPGEFRALLGLGLIARRRGEIETALGWLRKAAAVGEPGNYAAQIQQADLLREIGRFDESEKLLRVVLAQAPVNILALIGIALIARMRGEREAALDGLRRAVAADPVNIAASLELAAELRDLGRFDEAVVLAEEMRQQHPGDYRPWISLAQTRRTAGERDAAHAVLRAACDRLPGNLPLMLELANEERWRGRPQASERLLHEVLAQDPDNLQAQMALAENASVAGEAEAALRLLDGARARNPDHAILCAVTAQAMADDGRQEEALALLDAFAARNGVQALVSLKHATLLQGAGRWEEALAMLRAAQAEWPRHFGLWRQRFALERLLGGDLEAGLRAAPVGNTHHQAVLLHLRGSLEEDAWRLDPAIARYEQALAINPLDPAVHHDMTRAALLVTDLERARRHLRAFADSRVSINLLQSRSTNMSQTHLGQLLDEYALNEAALAELVALRRVPAGQRIEKLLDLVRREPDYTPAAIGLVVALREAGLLAWRAAPEDASPIPRTIMQYWDAPTPPDELAALGETWRAINPDFAYRRFDDGNARLFLARNLPLGVTRAYLRAQEPAQKADLFRLAYLFVAGGVYADMDDRCRAPIGALLPAGARLVAWQEDLGTIGNNFIAAAPGSPVIQLALRLGVAAINRGDADLLWLSTGPGLLTRAFAQVMADPGRDWREWLRHSAILLRSELHGAVACHCRSAYKRTQRHWQNSAFGRRAPTPPKVKML